MSGAAVVVVVVVVVVVAAAAVEAAVSTNLLRQFPSSTILDALSTVLAVCCGLWPCIVCCVLLCLVVLNYKCVYTCVAVSPCKHVLSKVPYLLGCKTRIFSLKFSPELREVILNSHMKR